LNRLKELVMPRGVLTVADTKEEAEQQILAEAPHIQILRSREIDLAGLPPLAAGALRKHWVVVVQHPDPNEEAKLPQHDDPEEHCEREIRLLYLSMAVDPNLLVSGVIEEFPCPACDKRVRLELPAPCEGRPRTGAACPNCRTPLTRTDGNSVWEVAPPKPHSAPTCVFCAARADSYEHVVPAWISKRLGIKNFLSANEAFVTDEAIRRKQSISFANYRARVFCSGCNEHFKHLEDAVIPLLVPMARGRMLSLDQNSQALVARWAHKTAIALLAAESDSGYSVPKQHLDAVRTTGVPGDHTRVGFFSWRGGPTLGTAQAEIVRRGDSAAPVPGYLAFLAFAQVGFCVTGFEGPLPAKHPAAQLPEVLQFWPPRDRLLTWPPPPTDNRILPALFTW
jgi:hypothetical protein